MANSMHMQNDFLALRKMSAWLEETGVALGIPAPQRFELDLVANEAVTNVISYGYPGGRLGDIELRLELTGGQVVLEIEDDGREFNPLSVDARVAPTGIDDASVGGLGIHLIRMSMPDCQYRFADGHNVFTMKAPLARVDAGASADMPANDGGAGAERQKS